MLCIFGLPQKPLHKLQLVHNSAAQIVTRTLTFHHITPILKWLRWPPVNQSINYKPLLFAFKAVCNLTPPDLSYLLQIATPARAHRSCPSITSQCPLPTSAPRVAEIPATLLPNFRTLYHRTAAISTLFPLLNPEPWLTCYDRLLTQSQANLDFFLFYPISFVFVVNCSRVLWKALINQM